MRDAQDDRLNIVAIRYAPLVVLLLAAVGGIMLDWIWPAPATIWYIAASTAWLWWAVFWLFRRDRFAAVLLFASVAAAGAAWHHICWHAFDGGELALTVDDQLRPACVEAIALTGPRRAAAPPRSPMQNIPQGEKTQLQVRIVGVRDRDRWRPASGRALLKVHGHLLDVESGDRVRVFATLGRAVSRRNPGEFDSVRYRRTRRALTILQASYPHCVTVQRRGSPWSPRRVLNKIRDRGNSLLHRYIDPRRASLASAILLGSREQLDPDRTEAFFLTGSIHLLAISGLHVGILAAGLLFIGRCGLISQRAALLGTMLFVIVYALLTDARPPVVRAAVLVCVVCGAQLIGRRGLAFNSLALAGLIVLAFNPTQLFQTGTQLSFLAVAVLIACRSWFISDEPEDPLDRLLSRARPIRTWILWPAARWLGGLLVTSTLISLIAMPLVLHRFKLISPSAILLNPLVWLPIAAALYSGFAVLLFGWLCPPLAHVCGRICDGSLAWIESCVLAARDVAGSHFWMPGPAWWWVLASYAAMACWLALPRLRPPRRWAVALLAVWLAVGVFSSPGARTFWRKDEGNLHCTFLAVGNGTSVLLELPDGRTLLYDAGRIGTTTVGARTIARFLWSRGVTHLDALVISHADSDHFNAIPELLQKIDVGVVYVSPIMFREEKSDLRMLREAIESADAPLRHISAGDFLARKSPVRIEALHPPAQGVRGSDNANSIVLRIDYAGRRILLPGDLEDGGMTKLLTEPQLDCDVVMAPHHGSPRSNPRGFAAWSTPEWVVVSGGYSRDLTPVRQAYQSAGAQVLHTAQVGAVRVTIHPDGRLRVRSWRKEPW